jgi:hypothetical protein
MLVLRDADLCGIVGGTSFGGVSGALGGSTAGKIACSCLSVFEYSGVGSRLLMKEEKV